MVTISFDLSRFRSVFIPRKSKTSPSLMYLICWIIFRKSWIWFEFRNPTKTNKISSQSLRTVDKMWHSTIENIFCRIIDIVFFLESIGHLFEQNSISLEFRYLSNLSPYGYCFFKGVSIVWQWLWLTDKTNGSVLGKTSFNRYTEWTNR